MYYRDHDKSVNYTLIRSPRQLRVNPYTSIKVSKCRVSKRIKYKLLPQSYTYIVTFIIRYGSSAN